MKTPTKIKTAIALFAIATCFYQSASAISRAAIYAPGHDSSGVVITHYGNGHLRTEIPYEQGMKNGTAKEFYDNGQLKCETPYDNNIKVGIVREYYENGDVKSETTYMDGVAGQKTLYKPVKKGR